LARVIRCPHCSAELPAAEVLDGGTVCVPERALVHVLCPRCDEIAWAEVKDGHIALGPPVADADLFRPRSSAAAPQLSVRPDQCWLDCWYEGRYRRFPAAR
jgi:hypothetical protein